MSKLEADRPQGFVLLSAKKIKNKKTNKQESNTTAGTAGWKFEKKREKKEGGDLFIQGQIFISSSLIFIFIIFKSQNFLMDFVTDLFVNKINKKTGPDNIK